MMDKIFILNINPAFFDEMEMNYFIEKLKSDMIACAEYQKNLEKNTKLFQAKLDGFFPNSLIASSCEHSIILCNKAQYIITLNLHVFHTCRIIFWIHGNLWMLSWSYGER
jgi:hypothetical protein